MGELGGPSAMISRYDHCYLHEEEATFGRRLLNSLVPLLDLNCVHPSGSPESSRP
ncbi:hypothetical protein AB0B50_04065 [Streptomyces sp. NPDC041068]|uniref:hypothetical protein n=1 Tax=Streptomyces sp. NPDC041068 TaxID=3155130 RepID=UPI0033DF0EE4